MTNKKILMISTLDDFIHRFLIPHIDHLKEQGNEVECACNESGFWFKELQEKHGITMHKIPFGRNPLKPSNLKAYKQLKQLQKQNKYDVIYCHTPVGGFMGRMLAKKFKIPCIYMAHGFHFYNGCPLKNKLIFKTLESWASKYTDILITINNEDYEAAKKMKAKKVFKINGIGVDFSTYKKNENLNQTEFRKSLGIKSDDFVVTSVGELNENKNTFRLLEVIKNLNNPKIKYLICGQGPLGEKYKKYIEDNNLQDNIKLLGFRKDIPDILTITDLYIMPSYREGLSKSMMEAMCYGLPIVASKIRGNTDLVGDNEGGILCSPTESEEFKQAISTLFENKELCEKYSKRNLE
ncbi:MAG: glycosyltransferase family 4 protein, partial [Clostridia bacterium]|nr:glycosyltransferase family 4 protein [Clostridia bacterium]